MIGLLIDFLIVVVFVGIVYWVVSTIISYMGMPWGPLAIKILGVVCLLIILLWFLSAVAAIVGHTAFQGSRFLR